MIATFRYHANFPINELQMHLLGRIVGVVKLHCLCETEFNAIIRLNFLRVSSTA